jgi:hypothetical protein
LPAKKIATAVAAPAPAQTDAPSGEAALAAAVGDGERPYQAPLVFLKSDVLGIDIGGSVAEKGAQFALGYAGRNIALIPVVAESQGRGVTSLLGSSGDEPNETQDAYSVLGQFKADTATTKLGYGFERYFATGVAARNLADGLQAQIIGVPKTKVQTAEAAPATVQPVAQRR